MEIPSIAGFLITCQYDRTQTWTPGRRNFHCRNRVHFAIYGWTLTQSQEKSLDEHTNVAQSPNHTLVQ